MSNLSIIDQPIAALKPNSANARTHSPKQIQQIANSIDRFGFNNPILVDNDNMIIAGHGRFAAAQSVGQSHVPTILLEHLTEAQKRAYIIADNRLAELSGWDKDILAIELQHLLNVDIDFEITDIGFETAEIDLILCIPVALRRWSGTQWNLIVFSASRCPCTKKYRHLMLRPF